MLRKVLIGLVVLAVIIQLVPVDRSAPPEGVEVEAPPEVMNILQRACYDCHSSRTKWPWYSKVAPVSWWIADHVHEGREHLNFTDWGSYSPKDQSEAMEETWEEVEEGEMPLPSYVLGHPEAKLSEADKKVLKAWCDTRAPEHEAGEHEHPKDDHDH